ncbi:MAG: ANTAR domain-containing protein [Desulfarculaceae bacterium]|jgi:response regulator NasT
MSLNLVLVENSTGGQQSLEPALKAMGHQVLSSSSSLPPHAQAKDGKADLIIFNLATGQDLAAAPQLPPEDKTPVLLVSPPLDGALGKHVAGERIYAYVVQPADSQVLEQSIHIALNNFRRETSLRRQITSLRETLKARKTTERAKGVLMDEFGMSESVAQNYLDKESQRLNLDVVELAESILNKEFRLKAEAGE